MVKDGQICSVSDGFIVSGNLASKDPLPAQYNNTLSRSLRLVAASSIACFQKLAPGDPNRTQALTTCYNMVLHKSLWVIDALEERTLRVFQQALLKAGNTLAFCGEQLIDFQIGICAISRPPETEQPQLRVLQNLSKVSCTSRSCG